MEELSKKEPLFSKLFKKILFSEKSKETNRNLLDKKTNEKIDALIDDFLVMVSPYLFLRCAQNCIEWLLVRLVGIESRVNSLSFK